MLSWERRRQRGALASLRVKRDAPVRVPASAPRTSVQFCAAGCSSGWATTKVSGSHLDRRTGGSPPCTQIFQLLLSNKRACGCWLSGLTWYKIFHCYCAAVTMPPAIVSMLCGPCTIRPLCVVRACAPCDALLLRPAHLLPVFDLHEAELLGWQGAASARAAVRLLSVQGLSETRRFRVGA